MDRRRAWIGCLTLVALLVPALPAHAFIEKLTHLADIIKDADQVFVAHIKSVDPMRPSMVLERQTVLKGDRTVKRMPINLTGDKEKHTPHLLKRVAPELPVIVFITELEKRYLGLVYTNGTWFQVIGQQDGEEIRWAFTHIEIYLRRTFRGTTAEMQQVVTDAVFNKKKPPLANPKEPAGFGPEIEEKPAGGEAASGQRARAHSTLFAVIALPFLMPIAALFNLLFPGLLREQWRQYQIVISVLITQSTLIFTHFALREWVVKEPGKHPWLSNEVLWLALVGVAMIGLVVALVRRLRQGSAPLVQRPVRVEYLALGVLLLAGLGYGIHQFFSRVQPFRDEMGVVTAGAALGFIHLLIRRWRSTTPQPALVSTELVFLTGLAVVGGGLGWYLHQPDAQNLQGDALTSEWLMSRGNAARTGSFDPQDAGPKRPTILWAFDPAEKKGRVSFHSTPTIVDGQLYIGAMHEVQAFTQGYVYCVNARDGRLVNELPLKAGYRLWRFSAEGAMKAVFSSPTVHAGQIFIGEGYHQDQRCRLYCLDGKSGALKWAKQTSSHVESSPAILGHQVIFGAGDDGLICVSAYQLEAVDGVMSPKTIWQVPGIHVDSSPLIVDRRAFVGSILGDVHKELHALAVDINTGKVIWQVPAPMPVLASPSHADGRVFFGLGNGKLGQSADQPAGALWCLDATSGRRLWEYPVGDGVLATPALFGENVYCGSTDHVFYCLRQADGQLVWKANLGSPLAACPVVAGGRVYVLTSTAILVCLDAATGAEHWRLTDLASEGISDAFASPVLAQGRLYFASGGKVYCVGDQD